MTIDIITIFPEIFKSFLSEALIARAQKKGIADIRPHNLRRWTSDRHQTVDDRPYGGGAGMVLMVEPIAKAIKHLRKKRGKTRMVVFSAKGKKFNQAKARAWSKLDQLILVCGRYEGIDERVIKHLADEEISIGDYVLFGGEVPAMVVTEAVVRLLPGAVGKRRSLEDESFQTLKGLGKKTMSGLLEYPHFTRPETIRIGGLSRSVPKVLLSGNHAKVESWRRRQSVALTRRRRPDLIKKQDT